MCQLVCVLFETVVGEKNPRRLVNSIQANVGVELTGGFATLCCWCCLSEARARSMVRTAAKLYSSVVDAVFCMCQSLLMPMLLEQIRSLGTELLHATPVRLNSTFFCTRLVVWASCLTAFGLLFFHADIDAHAHADAHRLAHAGASLSRQASGVLWRRLDRHACRGRHRRIGGGR